MSEIVPYLFESKEVRVVLDDSGEPWFVAADVCAAIGISNNRDALGRLDADEKGVGIADTLGGPQQVATVSEAGVYRLVFTSRVDGAERFKRWLAHEVLPSIRKTGRYEAPSAAPPPVPALPAGPLQDRVAAFLAMGQAIAAIPGVSIGIAYAHTLDAIHQDTGLITEPLRKALPAATGEVGSMTPTKLGKALGMSAQKVNKALEAAGLQRKSPRGGWELTETGAAHGEMVPFSNNGHAGYQPLWKPSVVGALKGGA